jgi:hypothetical protein
VVSIGGHHRLDATGSYEIAKSRFADSDVTADLDELDSPFRDKSADETRRSAQPVGRRAHGKQPIRWRFVVPGHAALPVAERSPVAS